MGYIDDNSLTVDAVLTRRGRELLSSGEEVFNVSHWALADDGTDYRLWDHLGQDNYPVQKRGHAIEDMPILEPNSSGVRHLRNKLIKELPSTTDRLPVMWLGAIDIANLPSTNGALENILNFQINTNDKGLVLLPRQVNPALTGGPTRFAPMGYTAVVRDSEVISISGNTSADVGMNFATFIPSEDIKPTMGNLNEKRTATVSALWGFNIRPKFWQQGAPGQKRSTVIFIYDNETGAEIIVTVEVQWQQMPILNITPPLMGPGGP